MKVNKIFYYESLKVITGLQSASQCSHDNVHTYDANFTLTESTTTPDSSIFMVSTVMISCVSTASKS